MEELNEKSTELGRILKQRGLSLATAESCTGGLLGHMITNVQGSSNYFLGGVVTYSNESKENVLGVTKETLGQYGSVSRECVLEMASGVRNLFQSELGLAISGIAGPEGGTEEKPVGTVFISLIDSKTSLTHQFLFDGDRIEIKKQTCLKAIKLIMEQYGKSSEA
ncbi:MAG: CinA family protein [Thermoplasmata archaeon]|nr:MAG: CinA family protein [Thermoplasmata archaeon]